MAANKTCQSCSMPMRKDALGGGTNADGSKTTLYCSHCYRDGKFTLPDITADGMQKLVQGKLREFGMPGFVGWFLTRSIPRLGRWREPAR